MLQLRHRYDSLFPTNMCYTELGLLTSVLQKRAESASANKGKLGSKLAAQKAQTQAQTLNQVSRTERAARDVDGVEAARRWE